VSRHIESRPPPFCFGWLPTRSKSAIFLLKFLGLSLFCSQLTTKPTGAGDISKFSGEIPSLARSAGENDAEQEV
jgi:hypothetical protein